MEELSSQDIKLIQETKLRAQILKAAIITLLIVILPFFINISISYAGRKNISKQIIVTDMANRVVIIPHKPKRIVTSFKPATLCLFALGLEKKIVGIDNSSKYDKLHMAIMPEVVNLTGVGSKTSGLNFETIVSLKPDLVILYAQKDGISLASRLKMINIPSIIILPENFHSIKKSLAIIAKAAGIPERAKLIENAMDSVLNLVKKRIKSIPQCKRKTGYFASSRGLFSTATGNLLQDKILTKAGIINVAHNLKGYFQDISPEQLIEWNPDIILLSQHIKSRVAKRLKNPALQSIKAIKTKKVYRFPSNLAPWDFPSPLSALGVLWLADKIYPDRFKDININKEINKFHKILFGKTFKQMGGKTNEDIFGNSH